ncbi:MAG: alpha/beta hydrolase [Rhodoglobus sp.]
MATSTTQTLQRDGGSIAYDISGDGPLVVCIPGMLDLRSSYRHIVPALVDAGYRVAVTDLRGHGDSDATFDSYDNAANAGDIEALIEHLGGPAVIVGNSMGAAIGVLVAAARPELVSGLALIGPFVRNGRVNGLLKAVMSIATTPALAAATWKGYYPSLNKGHRPADFAEYSAAIIAAAKRPGYRRSTSRTLHTSHDDAEAQLPNVHTEVLVIMGELDPDFPSPADEANWIVEQLGGEVLMVADAAHYPQSQRPDVVAPALIGFLSRVAKHA